jgi:thiol:disulfide interchange protein DsbD
MMLVYGICVLIGAASGAKSVLHPLNQFQVGETSVKNNASLLDFKRVHSIEELNSAITSAQGKTVMLDFYADWCVACKEMEANTFSDSRIKQVLKNTVLIQADVTDNTPNDTALLKRFGLFGPPGIIFFDREGQELKSNKVIGYQDSEKFLSTLNVALAP